jgi:hypothetical protein
MRPEEMPKIPVTQVACGLTIYIVCILSAIICIIGPCLALVWPQANVSNPHLIFGAIFEGKEAAAVWETAGASFEEIGGGHFYIKHFFTPDGFTQFGLALGCAVSAPALLIAALFYLKEKDWMYVLMSLWGLSMVILSASGIVAK